MKKYQYAVVKMNPGETKLIGPLKGIRETVQKDLGAGGAGGTNDYPYCQVLNSAGGTNDYPYCQVLNGKVVAAFRANEIYDTDEAIGV